MTRPRMRSLTPRQREILDWVKAFSRDHGMPPTMREIGSAFSIKSSSVFELLEALERKGHLERGERKARSLIVKGRRPRHECGCQEVRVVGLVRAGAPIEAIQHERGTVPVRKDLLRGCEAFALKVEGSSMVGAGILDGDCVIVRRQETAEDGDVVVALIGDEATLKRFHREKDRIRLDPANRKMKPIYPASGEFRIQGKVIALHRTM